MLQWFNKQTDSSSLDREGNSEHSLSSSVNTLNDDDYEFLFNQLLDGVSHGWHLGRIIKFFNDLEPRGTIKGWVAWFERFESKVVYANDPARRRVGAIMMRLGDITQPHEELEKFGSISQRIGKKLFIGDVSQLIWEYDGKDLVAEDEVRLSPTAESVTETTIPSASDSGQNTSGTTDSQSNGANQSTLEATPETTTEKSSSTASEELVSPSESIDSLEDLTEQLIVLQDTTPELETESDSAEQGITSSQNTLIDPVSKPETTDRANREISPEFITKEATDSTLTSSQNTLIDPVSESETNLENSGQKASEHHTALDSADNAIDSLEELTEQLTVLQDAPPEPEAEPELAATFTTEQPTVSPDLVPEPENPPEISASNNSVDSLAELTEQLTVLQEELSPEQDIDSEPTLVAPEPSSPSSSVASFLEAAKTLAPEAQKERVTPLTVDEFVVALEQDPKLAQQVAQHLQIESNEPREIIKVVVEQFEKTKTPQLSAATIELVESWFQLGLKQASAEDFQGAIASWDKALELNPNLSEAWHNRGSALGRLGKYEAAIQSFNKAIKITPKRHQAWNDRAHALYQIQQWQQAIESWDKAIAFLPDNYQFWYNRGCALEQLQRFDESISSYEKALEIKPDFQPARSRYISLIKENSPSSIN